MKAPRMGRSSIASITAATRLKMKATMYENRGTGVACVSRWTRGDGAIKVKHDPTLEHWWELRHPKCCPPSVV